MDEGATGTAVIHAEWERRYAASTEGSFDKFRVFLDQIITDGDWEYEDGTPMTEDAGRLLAFLESNES